MERNFIMTYPQYIDAVRAFVSSERFQSKIDKSGPCWVWTGALNNRGYPRIRFQGRSQYAHRLMAIATYEVPDFEATDHLCRNTSCVKPSHLEPVTHRTNVKRGLKSALKQTCGAGLHLWVEENIYIRPDNGRAHCKPCRLERSAEYRKRSK